MLEFIAGAALGGLAFGGGGTHTIERHTGSSHVDVHEHRAPTDESVKLLREMEEKARDQIVGAFVTKSNEISGAVIYMQPNPLLAEYHVYTRFKLNGQDYEFKNKVDDLTTYMTKEEAYLSLATHISKAITNKFMLQFLSENKGTV